MKINKLIIIVTSFVLLIIVGFLVIKFFEEANLKNKGYFNLVTLDNRDLEYNITGKKIFVFSTDCEKCIDDLKWLSNQAQGKQKLIDLVSVSTCEDTIKAIRKMNLACNIYIDNKKEIMRKCNVSATPSVYVFVNNDPVEVKGGLKNILEKT